MTSTSVRLEKLSQQEFDTYYLVALERLANEMARARDLSAEEALKLAQQSFDSLLPRGRVGTTDQYLFKILAGDTRVGILHFGIKRDRVKPFAFVWDIEIHSTCRGKGYGELSMLALESKVKELGLSSIGLNVFGHNATAIRLYKKLGYRISSMAMVKDVYSP